MNGVGKQGARSCKVMHSLLGRQQVAHSSPCGATAVCEIFVTGCGSRRQKLMRLKK